MSRSKGPDQEGGLMMVVSLALCFGDSPGLERRSWALPWSERGERKLWASLREFHRSDLKKGAISISFGDAEQMARGEETEERLVAAGIKRLALLNLTADDAKGMEALGEILSAQGAAGPLRERLPFSAVNRPFGALTALAATWEAQKLAQAIDPAKRCRERRGL